jgi:hypothetical protein
MKTDVPTPETDFTRDVLGRYACNTFDDMLVTIDHSARSAIEMRRGEPPGVDPHSGYLSLQTHTGNVAFANIRMRPL